MVFGVLGSHFSEGIDLTNDKLIGVIVVGVGMPQIGVDRNIIKKHFDKKGYDGFDYAYTYPGMIKVLQAAGRCIRTDSDKGIIMLIDNRYSQEKYKKYFQESGIRIK
ncbi:helicase C-terminal domain-containing protein [Paraclostridium bifermentans]|nr:helicase C-terminal domain-containing protein [Paraclostridium bifermentans]